MRSRLLLCLFVALAMTGYASIKPTQNPGKIDPPRLSAAGDTVYIAGGTLSGGENTGALETAINQDTLAGGVRKNAKRVYALNEGQVYFQQAALYFNDPNATLIIVGIPSSNGTQKPIIVMSPANVTVNVGQNQVYGSLVIKNVHWQVQQTNKSTNNELFLCGTGATQAQKLVVDNCLFEFANIDIFDCTNESGAIGGWTHGASVFITNSYFRNIFYAAQWWDSRVFQLKHPIDTMWIENNTFTGGGLTFLQQNQLTDVQFINHNTIVNNKKYWLLSPFKHISYITNNIFVNQNWIGEDTNVALSGQDPDKGQYECTINVDTNNYTNAEQVQDKYKIAGDTVNMSPQLNFDHMRIYVGDNVNYYDASLINGYYNSSKYLLPAISGVPSYINWGGVPNPTPVRFMKWMNDRTTKLFADHHGPFIEARTTTANPNMTTPALATADIVDSMAVWNQNLYGDTRYASTAALTKTKYIFGDYDPTTIPGVKTEDGNGITKFTDLTESFAQTTVTGGDGLPAGSLIWNDGLNTTFMAGSPAARFEAAHAKYLADGGVSAVAPTGTGVAEVYSLSQNYPNPFNPTTEITFVLPKAGNVTLTVFNMLGQKVATLINGSQASGVHSVTFNATNLSSGTYFYRLESGSTTLVKKMMLLK